MIAGEEPEEMSPVEQQLARHLELLQAAPDPPPSLTNNVVRTARWQRAVRSPLLTLAHFTSAAAEATRMLLGGHA
jgi:hypothetical protein